MCTAMAMNSARLRQIEELYHSVVNGLPESGIT
jgi:hypothetical protein